MTLHLIAGKRWTGSCTLALRAIQASGHAAVAVVESTKVAARMRRAGVQAEVLSMSGLLGALHLSRLLRLRRPAQIVLHSSALQAKALQAIKLACLDLNADMAVRPQVLPPVEVDVDPDSKLLLWVGYITADCGLRPLIEALKTRPEYRLRVIGEGEAKIVGPLLRIAKNPVLAGRIEWVGEQENVFAHFHGASAGIITCPNPMDTVAALEFKAAKLPILTQLP